MKLKKMLILLIVLFLTGCTTDYTLTLNEDSSINEKAIIEVEDSEENYKFINKLINKASNNKKANKKDFKVVREVDSIKTTYEKKYDNIDEYLLNSFLYKQVFDKIDFTKTRNNISLETDTLFYNNNLSINNDNVYDFDYLKINIDSKLPVISENADKKDNNVYSWIYNKKQKNKSIKIKYESIPTLISIRSILTLLFILLSIIIITLFFRNRIRNSQKM